MSNIFSHLLPAFVSNISVFTGCHFERRGAAVENMIAISPKPELESPALEGASSLPCPG